MLAFVSKASWKKVYRDLFHLESFYQTLRFYQFQPGDGIYAAVPDCSVGCWIISGRFHLCNCLLLRAGELA